ncbi:MAG: Spy/CpxP family protein refolding chaperone [Candidatus Thiodiazotropha sp.]
MKPTSRTIAIITLSTLLFTSAGAAVAFGGPKGHGGCDRDGRGGPMAALLQIEDLTAEQKKALKDIRNGTKDAMRDLRDAMHDNRTDLHDAMVDEADLETIRGLAEKQGDQVTRMIVLRAEVRNKIAKVLTEEQLQQLQDQRWSGKMFGPGRHKGF